MLVIDNSPRQTKRVNDTTLSTDIAASEYGFQRTMNIEVRSQSNPTQLRSNPGQLVVQAPPEPPFKYVGRLGEEAIFEMLGSKEIKRFKRGDSIQGQWRLDNFTNVIAEVTLTTYDIKKQVPMQDARQRQ